MALGTSLGAQDHVRFEISTLLTGIIHPSLDTLQQHHYSHKSKKSTGPSWTAQLIQRSWHLLYKLWLLQNHTLHQCTFDHNHGIDNLDYSITAEYHRTQEYGTIVRLVLQKEIERAIIKGNEAKYHKTEGTSDLLSPEFIRLCGHYGEKEDIEKVLDGTFITPTSTSDAAKAFLEACQRPNEVSDIKEDEDPVNRVHTFIKIGNAEKKERRQ